MESSERTAFLALLFLLIAPGIVEANVGVPMIFLVMPALGLSIIPIIIIETVYLFKCLEIAPQKSALVVTSSNLVSTIVGIPLAWLLLVAIQIATGGSSAYGLGSLFTKFLAVTWQAPWLIPYERDLHWMIPVAGFVLLIPFFFVSWWVEYLVTKNTLKTKEPVAINKAVRNANLITYGALALWPIVAFIFPNAFGFRV